MKIPYIKIYTADLLAKSRHLSAEQIGKALIGICEQAFENQTQYRPDNEAEGALFDLFTQWKNESVSSLKVIPYSEANCVRVPLIGRVAAGYNCHAEENISEYIMTDSDILKDGYQHFWLEVKGDSMEPELHEKDLVLVREQEVLDKECYAVVNVDAEDGLVKLVDIRDTRITLSSVNPYYPPRVFEFEEMNRVKVIGPVIEVKRRF